MFIRNFFGAYIKIYFAIDTGERMNIKRRILSCLILLAFLAVMCFIGVYYEKKLQPEDVSVMSTKAQQNEEGIRVALTFDDGPHPYYTEQLLDGLKEREVSVTFFVTGENASLYPDIVERMANEGHLIGNHTYSHMQLTTKNREAFKQELLKTNEIIKEITGREVVYVRPPYGSWDKSFEKEINMFPVLWSVDPLDWCSDNVSCITENVVSKVKENDIILMHDYYASSVTAALKIVDELKERGYVFVTVEELLFD